MSGDRPRALVSWSGGKDCALALRTVLADPGVEVAALLTTVTETYDRISMHGVRRSLLAAQAGALGLPLVEVPIPPDCPNHVYEARMAAALDRERRGRGINAVVFGDLFLQDIRAYRESKLEGTGITPLFPIWKRDTAAMARALIDDGFRATLCVVDPDQLDPAFVGRDFDDALLAELPAGVDPCGENGEFHTFVWDAPLFDAPVAVARGEVVERGGFWFCDLLPA